MRKTIYDIATEAEVSIATVSRVLNGSGYAGEHTRRKVLAVAARHGYMPSAAAQGMSTKRANTIGLIIAHDPDYFFMNTTYTRELIGISDVARGHGYTLLLEISKEKEIGAALYYNKRVDGLLLMGVRQDHHIMERMIAEKIPFVLIGDYHRPLEGLCKVDVDDFDVGYRSAEYLIGLGHTRLGFLSGSLEYASCYHRRRGYEAALRDHGLFPQDEYVSICEKLTDESVERECRRMLTLPSRITALCAFNDTVAVSMYAAAGQLGLRIPHDLSVIGVDDSVMAQHIAPALTTVWQPSYEKGHKAASLLIESLSAAAPRGSVMMQGKLIVRESCAAPG